MAAGKVTKNDLVDSVYQKAEFPVERQLVQKVVDSLFVELKSAIASGATIELRGFGTFEPRLRKGRSQARNPRTGERISVAPHYVAAFRAGRNLRSGLMGLPTDGEED